MNDARLKIYLDDHLALLTGEIELARRSHSENPASQLGGFLERLLGELVEQRSRLRDVLHHVGGSASRAKQGAGWLAEKLGRLKLNDALLRYSPLSRLIELESLAVAASARLALWDNLATLRADDPRLARIAFAELREQTQRQLEELDRQRRRAAREAL